MKLDYTHRFPVSHARLRPILESYGISLFTFEEFTQGIANTTLGILQDGLCTHVLRIYPQQRKKTEDVLFQIAFEARLRAAGIPTAPVCPTLLGELVSHVTFEGVTWQAVLSEFIPGQSKSKEHTETLLQELATYQATMHLAGQNLPPRAGMLCANTLRDYYATDIDASMYAEDVQAFIDRAQRFSYSLEAVLPRGYCHLDYDLDGNVIVRDGHVVGIVDFDDLAYAPLVLCLGYSLWNVWHDAGTQAVLNYLKHYETIRPLSSKERETLPEIIRFRNYEIGALRLRRSGDPAVLSRPLEVEAELKATGML